MTPRTVQNVRLYSAIAMLALGAYLFLYGGIGIARIRLGIEGQVVEKPTKPVVKSPPKDLPPVKAAEISVLTPMRVPPGYTSTGKVKVTGVWQFTDGRDKGKPSGQYQLQSEDGIVTILDLCNYYPYIEKGSIVEVVYQPNPAQSSGTCSRFHSVRAFSGKIE